MDKNIVWLEGVIGDDYKYAKTQDGKEFATFTLLVRSYMKEFADKTEKRDYTYLRIMVFDSKLVEHLHKMSARRGHRVSVLARLNSHRQEYKGNAFVQVDIVARDIQIIKTNNQQDK